MEEKDFFKDKSKSFLFESARHTDVECVTHLHVEAELILVTEGTLHMTIGETEYEIPKGRGAFVPPFEPHQFASPRKNRCHVLIFSKELVPGFWEFVRSHVPTCHLFTPSAESMMLLERLLAEDRGCVELVRAQAVLAPLCFEAYEGCEFAERTRPLEDMMTRALEYMSAHFTEELSLEKVAHAIGLHPVTLSKLFAKRGSIHFNFYLRYLRCSYAASLLKSQDTSVTEAAYAAGFGSVRSLHRAFREIYGASPLEYRASTVV